MERTGIVDVLYGGTEATELVLLRVEGWELLITVDRPRRLIEMARAELSEAVSIAANFWDAQGPDPAAVASVSEDPDVQAAWSEFRRLLADSAKRSAEASAVIAGKLAVADDVLGALGAHREYGPTADLRGGLRQPFRPKAVLA